MKFYYKVKLAGFSSGLLFICLFYLLTIFGLDSSVKTKNIEADTKYLRWQLSNNEKISNNLKKIISSSERIEYLAQESQLDLSANITQRNIDNKIQNLIASFQKRFNLKINHDDINFLHNLLKLLIEPEFMVFNPVIQKRSGNEQIYKNFLKELSQHKTPVNTTLEDWTLRYLTSEALIIGLPMVEKFETDKKFNQLQSNQKEQIISSISKIVTNQFITNLKSLENKYNFKSPDNISQIIDQKIALFLRKKFET